MEKLGSSITLIRELGFGPYPTSYLHQHFDHSKLVHWKMEDLEYTSELVVILEKKEHQSISRWQMPLLFHQSLIDSARPVRLWRQGSM
jgi:hypothetical protein